MELKEFVAKSLQEVIEAIAQVQVETAKSKSGAVINPHLYGGVAEASKHGIMHAAGGRSMTFIDFDIAVTATEGTGTKAGIGVFGGAVTLGSSGESKSQNESVSRIKFRVPLSLPVGKEG